MAVHAKLCALCVFVALVNTAPAADAAGTPLIIDTDIGTDVRRAAARPRERDPHVLHKRAPTDTIAFMLQFDDSAALALVLSSGEFDLKLVLTATNDTTARAQIAARYLTLYGNTDVPVGVGVATNQSTGQALWGWAEDFPLSDYKGPVYQDGVGAAIDVIRASKEKVTILAIAPMSNFPSLVERCPDCAARVNVVAMFGSVYYGYGNSTTPSREYNVASCVSCSQTFATAGWPITITPLDTCGVANLAGDPYKTLLNGSSPMSAILSQSLLYWSIGTARDLHAHSDTWYDVVAAYLALSSHPAIELTAMKITVTDEGLTVPDPQHGTPMQVALHWSGPPGGLVGLQQWGQFTTSTIAGA